MLFVIKNTVEIFLTFFLQDSFTDSINTNSVSTSSLALEINQ